MRLVLPYPVSANRYWRTYLPKGHGKPVTVIGGEAREYRAAVREIARAAGATPIPGRVGVTYTLYPKRPKDFARRMKRDPARWDDTVQCIDLDNAQKVMFDALKGLVFADDGMIRRIVGERAMPDEKGARVELLVEAL